MIEFKNVSASYDGELAVLADVSFTVNDGDFAPTGRGSPPRCAWPTGF